ncbi:hypothetical protein DPMN_106096 [Dreissena polymorpha]|uniref:Uncharacterized protein n=1 Tax=Dreissena polymorpha TaxID=45954 RepID=A0A9D4QIE4_DREPO|nr:hypothetical protein DPMN_106096 [Dreissena polymorpha]
MKYIAVGILVVFVALAAVASVEDDNLSEQELLEAVERALEKMSNNEEERMEFPEDRHLGTAYKRWGWGRKVVRTVGDGVRNAVRTVGDGVRRVVRQVGK